MKYSYHVYAIYYVRLILLLLLLHTDSYILLFIFKGDVLILIQPSSITR